jgi:hypothetical protein
MRMPWPDWYFGVQMPLTGCSLSNPEEMPAKITRQHLHAD